MKRTLMILTIFSLLICMCACQTTPASNTGDPTQTTTQPTQTQKPTDPAPTETLPTQPTDPRIAEFQNLLTWSSEKHFYNDALTSVYDNPADVDLQMLFYDGFKDESQSPTELELELLEGKMGQFWKEMDLIRLPADKMEAVLTELFGITLDETNGIGLDNLVYLEETDCYYMAHSGTHYADVTVVYVETLEDGTMMVQYSAKSYGNYVVKLKPTEDGGYRILSNTAIDHLYTPEGVWNVVGEYFAQREAYLLETSAEMSNINPGILPDEASHLAAIHSSGVEWLRSFITIGSVDCWDSHAEAVVTETVMFRVNGTEQTETVVHTLQLGLLDDGTILVVSDGYQENTTGFTSCSYVPAD